MTAKLVCVSMKAPSEFSFAEYNMLEYFYEFKGDYAGN